MIQLNNISEKYKKLSIEQGLIKKELKRKKFSLVLLNKKIKDHIEASAILTNLSKKIQTNVKEYIEHITTMAIQTIFDEPITYHLDFKEKRNVMTCTPIIRNGKKQYFPKDDEGGAMQDIIGFIKKIVLWSIKNPRSRNTLLFDEPFRFCGDLTIKAAEVISKLALKLGIQIIIITHAPELADTCDRVWRITKKKYISKVERIK